MRGGNHAAHVPQVAVFVVEREHFLARRIDVKNRFPVGRPDDAVGISDRCPLGNVSRIYGVVGAGIPSRCCTSASSY